ncbi:MAG TPA: hypothetical protein PLP19_15965 [bacterium]|nr:hypothetical protein [bacterium]HPN44988.1 hypothetical protein [bacterium]
MSARANSSTGAQDDAKHVLRFKKIALYYAIINRVCLLKPSEIDFPVTVFTSLKIIK